MTYDPETCKREREKAEDEILEQLRKIEKRLYVDNGDLSIQTRLDRLTVAHLQNQWLARIAIGAVILHIIVATLERVVR